MAQPLPKPVVCLAAARLSALAQPVRIELVELLRRDGEQAVQELADALGATQQNVSKHLAVLQGQGLVEHRREGRTVRYRLASDEAHKVIRLVARQVAPRAERAARPSRTEERRG